MEIGVRLDFDRKELNELGNKLYDLKTVTERQDLVYVDLNLTYSETELIRRTIYTRFYYFIRELSRFTTRPANTYDTRKYLHSISQLTHVLDRLNS